MKQDRITNIAVRQEAGWPDALISAMSILEYGCDEGNYEKEAAAVLRLIDALQRIAEYDPFQGGPIAPRPTPTEDAMRRIAWEALA